MEAEVDVKPPFVVPITLREIIMSLKATNVIKGYVITDSIDIPAGITINYTVPVKSIPKSDTSQVPQIAIPLEFAAQPDPDYVIHGKFLLDNVTLIDDTAMSADMYNKPFEFFTNYSLALFAEKSLTAAFTNTSDEDAHLSFRTVFGVMKKSDYDRIVNAFAREVKDTFLKYKLPFR